MPPKLALFFCTLFVSFLLLLDTRRKAQISSSLWIPQIWMLMLSVKPLSAWINYILGFNVYHENYEQNLLEGSPIDRYFYLFLIIAGIIVLIRRRASWKKIVRGNIWILLFFFYCGLSVLWSDYPFVSFKRWSKEIGSLIMVIIILTEFNVPEAIRTLIRRIGFVHIPFSILLIKYFPEMGRSFSYSGELMRVGVALHKNSLGVICVVVLVGFIWDIIWIRKSNKFKKNNKESLLAPVIVIILTVWLLMIINSATATFSVILGCTIIWAISFKDAKTNLGKIEICCILTVITLIVFQYFGNVIGVIAGLLGRDLTFTGRTQMWSALLDIGTNSLIGTGYDSYWLGDRAISLKQRYVFSINQAHNGYLETYLNLGWFGLTLLLGMIFSGYIKIRARLPKEFMLQKLYLVFFVVALLMNVTEGYFEGLTMMWFIFLLTIFSVPRDTAKKKFEIDSKMEPDLHLTV